MLKKHPILYTGKDLFDIWEGCGFQILFNRDSLSSTSQIDIRLLSSTNFSPPEHLKLVSGIYHVCCQDEFIKPVTIRIEHCVTESSSKDLIFFASSNDKPNDFKPIKAKFDQHYGEIKVYSLGYFAILAKVSSSFLYALYLYWHTESQHFECYWDLYFFAVRQLEIYESCVKCHANGTLQFRTCGELSNEAKAIQISPEEKAKVDIIVITNQSLSKSIIDNYVSGNAPCCHIKLRKLKRSVAQVHLQINVTGLIGLDVVNVRLPTTSKCLF